MQSSSRWLLHLIVALAFLVTFANFTGQPALADDDLSEGIRLYGEKSFKDAINHLKHVSDKEGKPTALYYQALCLQGLGDANGSVQLFKKIQQAYPKTREGQMVNLLFPGRRHVAPRAPSPGTSSGAQHRDDSANRRSASRFLHSAVPQRCQ